MPDSETVPQQFVEVVVGYLVTLSDGFESRLGPDRTRADNYVRTQRAVRIEEMYVKRMAKKDVFES